MVDTREDILSRLVAIAATIPNMKTAQRNSPVVSESVLPTAIVFDADEATSDVDDMGMRPANRPTVVRMTPQIMIIEQSNQAGSGLTTFRRELVKRVLADTELNETIVKTGRNGNGAIRYLGCNTDFGYGRTLQGAMVTHFLFKYTMKPEDL